RSRKCGRSTLSITAERECFDPARRSMPARTSRESVIDVLSFILLISYHETGHAGAEARLAMGGTAEQAAEKVGQSALKGHRLQPCRNLCQSSANAPMGRNSHEAVRFPRGCTVAARNLIFHIPDGTAEAMPFHNHAVASCL